MRRMKREPFFLLFRREGHAPLIVDHRAMEPAQDVDLGDLRFDQVTCPR